MEEGKDPNINYKNWLKEDKKDMNGLVEESNKSDNRFKGLENGFWFCPKGLV